MHASPTIDPTRCPLCGQSNQCANEIARATGVPQGPCWCTTAQFPPDLMDRIPLEARRLACVCAACATGSVSSSPANSNTHQ